MVDVYDKIKHLLSYESKDDFYYLQVLQRKKDNPHIGSNSRVIKNYYISHPNYIEDRYDEIKDICNIFNARAMLRLNKRSYSKVAFKTIQNIANSMANGEYSFIKKSYDRACGNGHNDKNKTWIVDLDGDISKEYINTVSDIINDSEPEGNKIVCKLSTKNGVHLITKPFNPINLYIP